MKNITCDTYKVFPLNKESSNETILENNTDHIDSENEIAYELLDVELNAATSFLLVISTISTPIKRHNHEKASLTISNLSKKIKDININC